MSSDWLSCQTPSLLWKRHSCAESPPGPSSWSKRLIQMEPYITLFFPSGLLAWFFNPGMISVGIMSPLLSRNYICSLKKRSQFLMDLYAVGHHDSCATHDGVDTCPPGDAPIPASLTSALSGPLFPAFAGLFHPTPFSAPHSPFLKKIIFIYF